MTTSGSTDFTVTRDESTIFDLTELAEPPAAADVFVIVDVSDTTDSPEGTTKKVLSSNVLSLIPQVSVSAAKTFALTDAGTNQLHPSADTTARIWTIDANATVAFPVDTVIMITNQDSAGVLTIAITTDTMRLAGAGTTGSRTLADNGIAVLIKLTATEWIIDGTGLT